MDILERLVSALTREEVRHYKIVSGRTESPNPRKDWQLFDYLRKHPEGDDKEIFSTLYPDGDKNAYYRLRNRLTEELFKSQMILHFFDNEALQALSYLTLAKLYYSKNEFKVAHALIRKSERKALATEDFELLDVIYSFFIRLSLENVAIDPEEYIKLRQKNYERLSILREVDDLLASVNHSMKFSQNFEASESKQLKLLKLTIDKIATLPLAKESAKIRLKLYHAVSKLLLQTRDYQTLADYSLETYRLFTQEKLFTKANHEDKLQMLTYVVNALFKVHNYEASLRYSEELGKVIEEHHRLLYDKYVFFYYNSLVINYSQLNVDKAITLLEELKDNKDVFKNQPFYEVFMYLNLAIFRYQKKQLSKAIRELTQMYLHDHYKDMAPSLRLKVAMAEQLIRFDMGDIEIIERRLEQIKREFSELIEENPRDKDFIALLQKMMKHYGMTDYESQTAPAVKAFLEQYPNAAADSEVISYHEWLADKFQR
jgi:tetratricopeptide (TPR) repeat protein